SFEVRVSVGGGASERDATGFVLLTRGSIRRRIPYWFRVTAPQLGGEQHRLLARTGVYRDDTRRGVARVSSYRYPSDGSSLGIPTSLDGPEVVYRVRIRRPVANFGVAVLGEAPGVRVQPRVVVAGDENRLLGQAGLPIDLNPYLPQLDQPDPVAGGIRPAAGSYDVVFDTASRVQAGRFRFRFWVGDTTPPTVRLRSRRVRGVLRLTVADAGSGVDPRLVVVQVDGHKRPFRYDRSASRLLVGLGGLGRGRHRLYVRASDFQEAKNMENVGPILPNTRVLRTTFVRR